MKAFAVISIVLSSLLVVLWPIVFFFSAFIFDAPLHGAAEAARWVGVLWLWSYPLGYCVAFAYLFGRRKDRPWWKPPTPFAFACLRRRPNALFCQPLSRNLPIEWGFC